ncbi:MAG: hypothetical protein KME19_19240 [Microcoleus vaginatus WJT46-NPBG5]|nr:hypothetical protein [Microcoleus vaginatus WJT46-NPBG5]
MATLGWASALCKPDKAAVVMAATPADRYISRYLTAKVKATDGTIARV